MPKLEVTELYLFQLISLSSQSSFIDISILSTKMDNSSTLA